MVNFKLDKIIDHVTGKNRLDRTSAGTPIPFQEDDGFDQLGEEHA
jgi:hypothetical protein